MQPPQNPYNQPPLPNPGGDPNPYSGAPLPPQSTGVSLDIITEAWNVLKPQIGPWIGAALIYLVIVGLFSGLGSLFQTTDPTTGISTPTAMSLVLQLISTIIGFVVSGGLYKMAIAHLRTGRADIGEMFNIGDVAGHLILAGILTSIAVFVGFLLCIIPGVIAALGLSLTTAIIVDRKLPAIEAMKASFEGLKPHLMSLFLLLLVMGIVGAIGVLCTCGIGALVVFPLYQIALALVYRNVFLMGASTGSAPYNPNNFR